MNLPSRTVEPERHCFPPDSRCCQVVAAVLAFSLMAGTAQAGEDGIDVTLRGFGTFGAIGTSTDRILFLRDLTESAGATDSWGVVVDSRLGLQVDAKFNESWQAAVQWVARDHAGDVFEQGLDLALLRWRIADDLDLRFGRLLFDVFMLSDYRNVGYAYPWMRPPHEFYAGFAIYHFDGADIAKRFTFGGGYLTVKASGGYAFNQLPVYPSKTFDQQSPVAGASVNYERENWRAHLGYQYVGMNSQFPLNDVYSVLGNPAVQAVWPTASAINSRLSFPGKEIHYGSASLAYDDGTWLAQMEGSYYGSNVALFPCLANGYLSVGRRFGAVTVFTLLGIAKTVGGQRDIPGPVVPIPELVDLQQSIDFTVNKLRAVDEKSVSLGARWDVYENIALKAQWDYFWLGQYGAGLWANPAADAAPANVNVWSFGVDFVF